MRGVTRTALTAAGKQALTRVPQQVSLAKTAFPQWTNGAAVEQQAAPLRKEGFEDLGAYLTNAFPDLLIRMMAHPTSFVAAHIYDHPKSGSWIEFVTRYTNGTTDTLTTLPPTGMDSPEWIHKIQADKSTPTDQLYRQFLEQRAQDGIRQVAPKDAVQEFEEIYSRIIQWRGQHGISPEEVAHIALRVAQARAQSTNI